MLVLNNKLFENLEKKTFKDVTAKFVSVIGDYDGIFTNADAVHRLSFWSERGKV